jgi:mycofactocin precursor
MSETAICTAELEEEQEAAPLVEQDLLVEDVSIDGMCGVY